MHDHHHHDHSHEPIPAAPRTSGSIVWHILFALCYPVLITFSLLFTGILLFFSAVSGFLAWLVKAVSRKPAPQFPVEEPTAVPPAP